MRALILIEPKRKLFARIRKDDDAKRPSSQVLQALAAPLKLHQLPQVHKTKAQSDHRQQQFCVFNARSLATRSSRES